MKISQLLLVIILTVATALATLHFAPSSGNSPAKETAYQRVMRTSTLRCGYVLYPKFVERNPNTNAFSGLWVDLVEELGKQLSLKIEWTEEVGTMNAFDGLKAGRYDINCIPFTETPGRARATSFTIPVVYLPFYAYVRADDSRFDNAYEKINDPSVRYAYLEGELSQFLREDKFPKTQAVSLPNLTDISQILLNVAMGKADIATTEPSTAEPFLLSHPGKLKRVAGPPIAMDPTGFDVAVGENDLLHMINTTLQALIVSGTVEKLATQYTTAPDQFYLPALPWGASTHPVKPPS